MITQNTGVHASIQKVCKRCNERKSLTSFSICKDNKDGRQTMCVPCFQAHYGPRLNEKRRSPEYRAARNNYNKERRGLPVSRAREVRHAKKYRNKYPDKDNAKQLLAKAIRSGALIRTTECPRCHAADPRGKDGRTLIHAHHDDYSRPLIVRWMCVQCHSAEHLNDRALKGTP